MDPWKIGFLVAVAVYAAYIVALMRSIWRRYNR